MKTAMMWGCALALGGMAWVQLARDQNCETNPQFLLGRWDGTTK